MKNKKENNVELLSTRCEEFSDEGLACGPVGVSGVIAEAKLSIESVVEYVTVVWVSEAEESLEIDITKESLWPYLAEGKVEPEDLGELNRLREAGASYPDLEAAYSSKYEEIIKNLVEKIKVMIKDRYYDEDDEEFEEIIEMW